jgi:hypothetical protein
MPAVKILKVSETKPCGNALKTGFQVETLDTHEKMWVGCFHGQNELPLIKAGDECEMSIYKSKDGEYNNVKPGGIRMLTVSSGAPEELSSDRRISRQACLKVAVKAVTASLESRPERVYQEEDTVCGLVLKVAEQLEEWVYRKVKTPVKLDQVVVESHQVDIPEGFDEVPVGDEPPF